VRNYCSDHPLQDNTVLSHTKITRRSLNIGATDSQGSYHAVVHPHTSSHLISWYCSFSPPGTCSSTGSRQSANRQGQPTPMPHEHPSCRLCRCCDTQVLTHLPLHIVDKEPATCYAEVKWGSQVDHVLAQRAMTRRHNTSWSPASPHRTRPPHSHPIPDKTQLHTPLAVDTRHDLEDGASDQAASDGKG
jgi:hypothetical protein